jgi:CBS-domain-containing membrane protein
MRAPGAAPRRRAEYESNRASREGRPIHDDDLAYGDRLDERGFERLHGGFEDRGWLNRAADEVASWFGDEEAERRRRMDIKEYDRDHPNGRLRESRYGDAYSRTEAWSDVRAADVMTREVATVRPDDAAEHAARLMLDCDCGAIPVVDSGGRAIGMVTDRDIAVRLVARGLDIRRARVGDCMTLEVFACREGDSVKYCMREMARHQVRRLPVVDDRGRLVGIISQGDLARHAGEHRGRGERRTMADALYAVSEPSERAYR